MRIREKFQMLNDREEGAYMPHIYYGDPSESFSLREAEVLAENGSDFLEVGIPFSDPTSDGPVFQKACERALRGGTTPESCIKGIKEMRKKGLRIPIIVTTYYNIPFQIGLREFIRKLKDVKVSGIIIPNMPVEESGPLLKSANERDMDLIFQITPNTSSDRMNRIINSSSGFLYVVNRRGVTGVRNRVRKSTIDLIRKVRKRTDLPLMAGFGISNREQAKSVVSSGVNGAITGSALAKIYQKNLYNQEEALAQIGRFAKGIKKGCIEGYKKAF